MRTIGLLAFLVLPFAQCVARFTDGCLPHRKADRLWLGRFFVPSLDRIALPRKHWHDDPWPLVDVVHIRGGSSHGEDGSITSNSDVGSTDSVLPSHSTTPESPSSLETPQYADYSRDDPSQPTEPTTSTLGHLSLTVESFHQILPVYLWAVPVATAFLSFWTFGLVRHVFHSFCVWASRTWWLQDSVEEQLVQNHAIVQMVNGPIIVSITVLLASLLSKTLSFLQHRKVQLQSCLVQETQLWRQLQTLLLSPLFVVTFSKAEQEVLLGLFDLCLSMVTRDWRRGYHRQITTLLDPLMFWKEPTPQQQRRPMPQFRAFVELQNCAHDMTHFYNQIELEVIQSSTQHPVAINMMNQIRNVLQQIQTERSQQWSLTSMASLRGELTSLGILGLGFLMALLVQLDHRALLLTHGFPVRLLWSLVTAGFASIVMTLLDLSQANMRPEIQEISM